MKLYGKELARILIVGSAVGLLVIMPIWLVVVNSMKPLSEAQELGLGVPDDLRFMENFGTAAEEGRYFRGLLNSTLVSTISIGVLLFAGSLAGWIFARNGRRAMKAVFYLTISGIVLPISIVTTIGVLRTIGVHGELIGLIAVHIGTGMSLTVFLITGFVKAIPRDLEDSARVEGASEFRIFRSIIFPLLRPVHLAAGFVLLITFWNDFFLPLFILQSADDRTLPLGLFIFASATQGEFQWNLIFAYLILVSLPLILLFLLSQRWVTSGLSGAIKG